MEKETIFFSEGTPLQAIIGYPDTGTPPYPSIVLFHGHARHKNDGLDKLSQQLNKDGFLTLRFDFRGCGQTMHERYNIICHSRCPEDAANAITFLETVPEADSTRVGVTGISMGGCTAVHITGTDKRVKCAVTMAAVGDCYRNAKNAITQRLGKARFDELMDMIEADRRRRTLTGHSLLISSRSNGPVTRQEALDLVIGDLQDEEYATWNEPFMTVAALESLFKFRPEEQCPGITAPILYLHGADDTLVSVDESRRLYELTPGKTKKLDIVPGIDHNMPAHKDSAKVFGKVSEWFKQYL